MVSTPDNPQHDGSDLAALREEIDALKAIPEEDLLNPLPPFVEENEPTPHATDAAAKIARPVTKRRRLPSQSAARPPTRSNEPNVSAYPVAIHCTCAAGMRRSLSIAGSATFTMLKSS